MENSKLLNFVKLLVGKKYKDSPNRAELSLFNEKLQQDTTEKGKIIYQFFQEILKHESIWSDKSFTKAFIHDQLFPEKKYSDGRIRNLMTELLSRIKLFLVEQEVGRDDALNQEVLIKSIKRRGGFEQAAKIEEKILKQLDRKKQKTTDDYHKMAMLNQALFEEPSGKFRYQNNATEILSAYNRNLDLYYLKSKLILWNEQKERQYIVNEAKIPIEQLKVLLFTIIPVENLPVDIRIYLMRLEKGLDVFKELKEAYFLHFESLSKNDQRNILRLLINDAGKLYRQSQENFVLDIYNLYLFGFEHMLLLENGILTYGSFVNFISFAIAAGQLEVAMISIKKYGHLLAPSSREEVLEWAKAAIYFEKKQYEDVVSVTSQQHYSIEFFNLKTRLLEVQALYLLFEAQGESYERLISRINAFTQWLGRKTILSKVRKERYYNFLSYLRKFANLQNDLSNKSRKLERLQSQLSNTKPEDTVLLSWLSTLLPQSVEGP